MLILRPISSRLQLLTDLVTAYGVGGATGLSTEAVMNYAKNTGAFAHSNAEVRDSAKELTVGMLSYTLCYHPFLTMQLIVGDRDMFSNFNH